MNTQSTIKCDECNYVMPEIAETTYGNSKGERICKTCYDKKIKLGNLFCEFIKPINS